MFFPPASKAEHSGFTGTQQGMTAAQHDNCTALFYDLIAYKLWMHNGDCVGADEEAAILWQCVGGKLHLHPPENQSKRVFLEADATEQPMPYLLRNQAIVRASSVLVAAPKESTEQLRSGTWSTVRYARRIGVQVVVIMPDGSIE